MEHFDKDELYHFLKLQLAAIKVANINEKGISQLIDYFEMLVERNKYINLISPKQDNKTKLIIHIIDSLSPLLLKWPEKIRVLDFGSGGGLPAIPLAIVFPNWDYTLAESTGKKITFLNDVINSLQLKNVKTLNTYLELGKCSESSHYDLITARAVAPLDKLLHIAGPRMKSGSQFLAFKGPNAGLELDSADELLDKYSLFVKNIITLTLPIVEAHRMLILFERY